MRQALLKLCEYMTAHAHLPMIRIPSLSLSSFSLTIAPTTARAGARNANTFKKDVCDRSDEDIFKLLKQEPGHRHL